MTDLDILIGQSQRNITYGYIALFALALAGLVFLPKPIDEPTNTLLTTLLSVLGTILVQQSSFWFARNRPAGVPDPTTTTTVQKIETTTLPSKDPDLDPVLATKIDHKL